MSKLYRGIDISLYQGEPDFSSLKRNGIDFVMLKASQGRTAEYDAPFEDPHFRGNIGRIVKTAAQDDGGVYAGCYHYFCARNESEADAEADFFVSLIKPYRYNLQLWAALDVEDAMLPADKDALSACVRRFCDRVEREGMRPMVYSSTWWLNNRFTVPESVPVWEANWSVKSIPDRARMWQLGLTDVPGLGKVDTNLARDIIGDANGDGKVDAKDAAAMLKDIAGWKVGIDEGQADLDRDGYVTAKDVAELIRKLAGE